MLTYGSLFSGIGGIDLGLDRAGMQCKWQVEIDDYATKVLAKHWPDVARFRDIRECGSHNLTPVDLICGGFPCQDISIAGKKAGITGRRSGLWSEFYRIICELRPRYILVENVAALLYGGIERVLGNLAQGGYDAEWQVISAEALGAPHLRERVFIVAYPGSQRSEKVFSQLRFLQEKQGSWTSSCRGSISTRRENAARFLWTPEPNMVRVADGIPARMDRLRGLGNAVVPQVAEYIGNCIVAAVQANEEVAV